ncbi:MAG: S9 family peptidase, partial [Hyphomonadaceae bacterium]
MNRRNLLAALSTTALGFLTLNTSALAQTAADAVSNDPFLWLEEVEGEKALSWVRGQNARSLPKLTQDPRYAKLEEDALNIIRAKDRLTFGSYTNGFVSNFWQDTKHVRGIWRRADFTAWRLGSPAWETVLDIDKLAK